MSKLVADAYPKNARGELIAEAFERCVEECRASGSAPRTGRL